MTKSRIAIAIAAALAAPIGAFAADAAPNPVVANVGVFSDYRFRGISQTFKQPALQGGFDYAHSSGLYLGTWLSNVYGNAAAAGSPIYAGGSMEWDLYGGYKFTPIKDVTFDVGLLQYYYPNAKYLVTTKDKYDYLEAYVGASWKWFSAKYSYGLKNFFGLNSSSNGALNCGLTTSGAAAYTGGDCQAASGNSKGSGYLDLTATYEIMDKTNLIAHFGHQSVTHYGKYAYSDVKLGVTRDMAGLTFGASYITTNAKKGFYTIVEPDGAGGTNGKKMGDGTLLLSVSKTF